jgi:hypothetical protein
LSTAISCLPHHDQLSTYITGTVRRNRRLLPQQFKNKFSVGQKMNCRSGPLFRQEMYYRSGPLLTCVFHEKKSQKIPVIPLSRHAIPQEEEVQGRHGGNPQVNPKIITFCNKFMGIINFRHDAAHLFG